MSIVNPKCFKMLIKIRTIILSSIHKILETDIVAFSVSYVGKNFNSCIWRGCVSFVKAKCLKMLIKNMFNQTKRDT